MSSSSHSAAYPQHKSLAHLGAVSVAASVCLLLRFPPAENSFYPRCLFFSLFHLRCPGCGATRALSALLHGHLIEAMHWNAMFVVLLPFVILFLAISYARALTETDFHWPAVPTRLLAASVALVLMFAIVRDIYSL